MVRQELTGRGVGGRGPGVCPPRFVGRERELAVLAGALDSPPAVVLIEGEAGIGKSRLLAEFLASQPGREPGLRALMACCPPYRQPYTLGPLTDALRQAAPDGVAGLGLSPLAGALRPLFPEWADALPGPLDPPEDALAGRYRLFRAYAELLDQLGVSLLVVDDLHWADDATLELLLFLTARRPQPVSLIVAYRPEDVPGDSLLPHLATRPRNDVARVRLTLAPLDVAETRRLMSSMLAREPVSQAFASFVHRHTEGLPLAVEESVRLMADRAEVARHGGEWVRRGLDKIHVPPTVRDAVLERAQRLRPEGQAILRAAAVLMDAAAAVTLAEVAEVTVKQARSGVAEALSCGLLTEDARGMVAFRHTLSGRAVYDAIPVPDRQALHERAGTVLENLPRPSAAQLARHFKLAGDDKRWQSYAECAADSAAATGDWVGAATLLHDVLANADLPPAAVASLAAKIPPGSLMGTSPLREIARVLESALSSGALNAGQVAMTRYQLAIALDTIDAFDESRRAMELAIPDLPAGSLELVRGMVMLGWPRGSTCPGRVHRDWLRRASRMARTVPTANVPDVTEEIAIALLLLDEPAGWELAESIPDELSTPAQRRNVTRRDVNLADLAMRWGRYAEARNRASSAVNLAEKYGYPRYRQLTLATLVHLDWLTGVWSGLAERAAELAQADDTLPMNRLQASMVTGLLRAADGRHAEAKTKLSGVLTQMRDLGAAEWMVQPAAVLTWLLLATDGPGEALRVSEEPMVIITLKETWLWATDLAPARVAALVAAGREDEAAELVTAFARGIGGRDAPAAHAALTLSKAFVAEGRGENSVAAGLFGRAAAAWDALPRPYDALLARERQARCLLAAGEADSGLRMLAGICQGFKKLGARGDASRVALLLRDNGVGVRVPRGRGRPGYGDRLSPRELEVVGLVVGGRTNRQIADALVVSTQTVASHLHSAMRKLQVTSRTALAVSAVERGILATQDEPGARPPAHGARRQPAVSG